MKKLITFFAIFLFLVSMASAFSPLSVSQVSLSDGDSDFGLAWLLTVTEDGREDTAVGTFESSQLKSGVKTTQYPLTVLTSILDQKCKYRIDASSEKNLYSLAVETGDFSWTESLALAFYCPTLSLSCSKITEYKQKYCSSGEIFAAVKTSEGNQWGCFRKQYVGRIGNVQKIGFSFKERVSATVNGDTAVVDLSLDPEVAPREAKVNNKVKAYLNGALSEMEDCPDADEYGIAALHTGSWKLVDDSALTLNYASALSCLRTNLAISRDLSRLNANCLAPYAAQVTSSSITKSWVANTLASGALDSGKVIISNFKRIRNPVISMKIDADWIGVIQPESKPKIMSISSSRFPEGQRGEIVVDVKNEGTLDGSVSFLVTCGSGFSVDGQVDNLQIRAGQTSTRRIGILASITEDTSSKCTVRVQDANNPDKYDSREVTVSATAINPCGAGSSIGDTRCDVLERNVEQCTSEGWVSKESCDTKCEVKNGIAQCIGVLSCSSDEDCLKGDDKCKIAFCNKPLFGEGNCEFKKSEEPECNECKPYLPLPSGFLGWTLIPNLSEKCVKTIDIIKLLFSIILSGLAVFFLSRYFKNEKILKGKKGKIWKPIIFIVSFVLLYTITMQVFWYGLLGILGLAVIAIVIRLAIKR